MKTKIKIITILLAFLLGIFLFVFNLQAAPDVEINYQGKLTNTSDEAVSDGNYSFIFTIWDASTGGNCLWSARGSCGTPTAKTVSISKGIFSTSLGESADNAIDLDFDSNYFLQIQIESDSAMTSRKKIGVVGFAVNASRLAGTQASGYALLSGRSGGQILIGGTGTTDDLTLQTTSGVGATGADMHFLVGNDGGTEALTILNSGNVGIGVTNPNNKLEVNGTVNATAFVGDGSGLTGISGGKWSGDPDIYYNGGNVGIGTASPSQELDIVGDINLENTTTNDTGIIYKNGVIFMHNFQHPTGDSAVPFGKNTFLGVNSGNLTLGSTAINQIQSSYNTGVGYESLHSLTIGFGNSALGYQALYSNDSGYSNSAFGNKALYSNTYGGRNAAFGSGSLENNTSGDNNSAFGYEALNLNSTGDYNVAVGASALMQNTGQKNSALGYNAMSGNTSGDYNSAFGANSLEIVMTGSENSAFGYESLSDNRGSKNSAFGFEAGDIIADGFTPNTTGNNSVFVGWGSGPLANGDTNEIVIGYDAVGVGSNTAVLGNDSITKTILKGNVGIGTTSPGRVLEIKNDSSEELLRLTRGSTYFDIGVEIGGSNDGIGFWDNLGAKMVFIDSNAGVAIGNSYTAQDPPDDGLIIEGNAGIGITSPSYPLEIKKTTSSAHLMINGDYSPTGSSDNGAFMAFRDSDALRAQMGLYDNSSYAGGSGTDLFVASAGNISLNAGSASVSGGTDLFIDSSGEIGLGTKSPDVKLHLQGSGNNDAAMKLDQTGTDGDSWQIISTNSAHSGGGGNLAFYNNDVSAYRMYLESGGNLGVQTTDPQTALHVVKSNKLTTYPAVGSETVAIFERSVNTRNAAITILADNTMSSSLYLGDQDDENVGMISHVHSDNELRMRAGGYSYSLFVESDGGVRLPYVYSDTVGGTNRDLYIDSSGNLGYVSSSIRYKENIENLGDTSWLYDLRPVTFDFKDKTKGIDQIGLIAEEVEQINPYLVSYNILEDGTKQVETVNYGSLTVPMLKAVQEQHTQFNSLVVKTDEDVDNLQNFQTLIDEQLDDIDTKSLSLDLEIEKLRKYIDDQIVELENRILGKINLNSGLIETNDLRIAYLESLLGITSVSEGDVEILGKVKAQSAQVLGVFKAKEVEAEEIKMLGDDSSGKSKLLAEESEVVVETSLVNEDSKIYITPLSLLEGRNIWVDPQNIIGNESFVVKLEGELLDKDIEFNWMIIN